jgi:hypothetical protein
MPYLTEPRRLPVALQPLGCEHPDAFQMTAYGDPAPLYYCPGCKATWSDTTRRFSP